MKILVAWDDSKEAEVLDLYLSSGENSATIALTAADLLAQVRHDKWDAILMALTFPTTADEGFALFEQIRQTVPETPVVLALKPTELFQLPRFLNHGLRFHIARDNQADFVFLVLSTLESAVAST